MAGGGASRKLAALRQQQEVSPLHHRYNPPARRVRYPPSPPSFPTSKRAMRTVPILSHSTENPVRVSREILDVGHGSQFGTVLYCTVPTIGALRTIFEPPYVM